MSIYSERIKISSEKVNRVKSSSTGVEKIIKSRHKKNCVFKNELIKLKNKKSESTTNQIWWITDNRKCLRSFDNNHTSKIMAVQKRPSLTDNCTAHLTTTDMSKVGTFILISNRIPQHMWNFAVPSKTPTTGDVILFYWNHHKIKGKLENILKWSREFHGNKESKSIWQHSNDEKPTSNYQLWNDSEGLQMPPLWQWARQ